MSFQTLFFSKWCNSRTSASRSSKSAPRKSGSKSAGSSAAVCSNTRRKELGDNKKANESNVENDHHESLEG